ncbi:MAG: metallophosphoesterase N-terminal domain-containing protein, partial [Armatimonadota bacterium]
MRATRQPTVLPVALALLLSVGWASAELARGVVFHDLDTDGARDADEPGIEGVAVSNGRDVVVTDERGRWRLAVDDDTIFVIKPRGWQTVVDHNGVARGYYVHRRRGSPPLQFGGVE